MTSRNQWLVVAGWLSIAASLLHLGCIIGGPDWYRFFGAGEAMAQAAERDEWMPTLVTMGIATILAIWAAYAFSGAGMIARLPLLRTGLVTIGAIYLARGLVLFPILAFRPEMATPFAVWSSLIVLGFGIVYAIGTWKAWHGMTKKEAI